MFVFRDVRFVTELVVNRIDRQLRHPGITATAFDEMWQDDLASIMKDPQLREKHADFPQNHRGEFMLGSRFLMIFALWTGCLKLLASLGVTPRKIDICCGCGDHVYEDNVAKLCPNKGCCVVEVAPFLTNAILAECGHPRYSQWSRGREKSVSYGLHFPLVSSRLALVHSSPRMVSYFRFVLWCLAEFLWVLCATMCVLLTGGSGITFCARTRLTLQRSA